MADGWNPAHKLLLSARKREVVVQDELKGMIDERLAEIVKLQEDSKLSLEKISAIDSVILAAGLTPPAGFNIWGDPQ